MRDLFIGLLMSLVIAVGGALTLTTVAFAVDAHKCSNQGGVYTVSGALVAQCKYGLR